MSKSGIDTRSGFKKPFEQQAEPDGVQIGDGQRPGDHRPGAGTAPRPDRNALVLRPFDEVGNDQEVTRKLHADDDVEFVLQTLAVLGRHTLAFLGRFVAVEHLGVQPFLQTFARLPAQLIGFGDVVGCRKTRQDRRPLGRHHRATARDDQRVVRGFRQVGEPVAHFLGGLEVLLGRCPPPFALVDRGATGDTHQRIMGRVHGDVLEHDVVGRNQGQITVIGHGDQVSLGLAFDRQLMTLQLDIEPIGEHVLQLQEAFARFVQLAVDDQRVDRPRRTAGQRDQSAAMLPQHVPSDMGGITGIGIQIGLADQAQQVAVTPIVLGQQQDTLGRGVVRFRPVPQGQQNTDNRLDARLDAFGREFQRPNMLPVSVMARDGIS